MEKIPVNLLHYRLYEEIDTFLETGYCSYWKPELKFIKPVVEMNINRELLFKKLRENVYLIFDNKLGNNCHISLYYDMNKYYYHHYENENLLKSFESNDYIEIHQYIENEINFYRNILLNY